MGRNNWNHRFSQPLRNFLGSIVFRNMRALQLRCMSVGSKICTGALRLCEQIRHFVGLAVSLHILWMIVSTLVTSIDTTWLGHILAGPSLIVPHREQHSFQHVYTSGIVCNTSTCSIGSTYFDAHARVAFQHFLSVVLLLSSHAGARHRALPLIVHVKFTHMCSCFYTFHDLTTAVHCFSTCLLCNGPCFN